MQIVLNTPGTYLTRKEASFEISHSKGSQRISPEKVECILFGKGVKISSDAMLLALDYGIDMLLLDRFGDPKGRLWNNKFGSIATLRRKQLKFTESAEGRKWTLSMLEKRMQGMLFILGKLKGKIPINQLNKAINGIQHTQYRITHTSCNNWDGAFKSSLRGWEGSAAHSYFRCLSQSLPADFAFAKRSRRPARDKFNCALNYLYGILYGKIEGTLIKVGLDPSIGVFHTDMYNRPALVFDVMEVYRHWAEDVLIRLCWDNALKTEMFSQENGGLRVNREGKTLLIETMSDFLNSLANKEKTKLTHAGKMYQDCQQLASRIQKFDTYVDIESG